MAASKGILVKSEVESLAFLAKTSQRGQEIQKHPVNLRTETMESNFQGQGKHTSSVTYFRGFGFLDCFLVLCVAFFHTCYFVLD